MQEMQTPPRIPQNVRSRFQLLPPAARPVLQVSLDQQLADS